VYIWNGEVHLVTRHLGRRLDPEKIGEGEVAAEEVARIGLEQQRPGRKLEGQAASKVAFADRGHCGLDVPVGTLALLSKHQYLAYVVPRSSLRLILCGAPSLGTGD
jgi:hypothetical protein